VAQAQQRFLYYAQKRMPLPTTFEYGSFKLYRTKLQTSNSTCSIVAYVHIIYKAMYFNQCDSLCWSSPAWSLLSLCHHLTTWQSCLMMFLARCTQRLASWNILQHPEGPGRPNSAPEVGQGVLLGEDGQASQGPGEGLCLFG